MGEPVAVTGIGVVSPLSPEGDPGRFWARLCAGETAVGPVRSFDVSAYPCRVGAEVDRGSFRGGRAADDPALVMAALAFERALGAAGVAAGTVSPRRAGVVVGTVLGGTRSGERYLRAGASEAPRAAASLAQYPLRAIAAALAAKAGFAGPVLTVSTACASGTDAVGLAYRAVAADMADLVLAGGADALCELSFSGFCALRALTADAVRPFARNRTGLALGEGAAFLVVESEGSARRRGVRPVGRIAGYGARNDAFHLTAPHRAGRGLAAAAAAALRDGGCDADAIDYVSAHGTGTPYNDRMETLALKQVLGARAPRVPVSSVKGALGHSFGAAGAVEAAVCLLAIRDGIVPPTANLEEPDPECDLDYVPLRAREVRVRTALSWSAGFGGQNAALVIRGWP
jgi:3-oxoacyl-(acyl-carrier-protein) synthase